MRISKIIIFFFISMFFVSCESKNMSKIEEVSNYVSYKENGINIRYNAVPELNFYDSNKHRLVFTVYQLNDINNFKLLIKEEEELQKLIIGTKFDSTVLFFDTFSIMPNKSSLIKLDRVKGTKWVVLLAGYFDFNKKEDIYAIYQLSLVEDKWYSFLLKDKIEYNVLDLEILFEKNKFISKVAE